MDNLRNELRYKLGKAFSFEDVEFIMTQVDSVLVGYTVNAKSNLPMASNNVDIVKHYIEGKILEGTKASSIRTYKCRLATFARDMQKPLVEITTEDVRIYLAMLRGIRGQKESSVDGCRIALNGLFEWMKDEGYRADNPCKKIKKVRYFPTKRKPLTDNELDAVRYACRNHIRNAALIEFMYSTGCRAGEIGGVKISDIDFEQREVIVTGKGNKTRKVYLNVRAKNAVERYLSDRKRDSEYLFPGKQVSAGLTVSGIEDIVGRIGKDANLSRHIKPHEIRHTMATNAIRGGMPIEELKTILGHESLETTLIYVCFDEEKLKQDHKRCLAA